MKICFVSVEIFAWGKYGGFGRATRTIGRELVRRGVDVSAIIPRRGDQKPFEELDGIKVYGFEPSSFLSARHLYRQVDADIYHSEEPSFGTFLARVTMPKKVHLVTCRDTRDAEDWRIERSLPTKSVFQVIKNQLYEDNYLVEWAVRNADKVFAASYIVQEKARKRYHLSPPPEFLATPVVIPETVKKAEKPTVCFVARWDRRKRPEMFLELAKQFPQVNFIAVGASHDKAWDAALRAEYGKLPNLELPGFVDQFDTTQLSQLYEKSWILVNTAAREGLPNAFIEAAAHRCAILSSVNPDEFATQFGYFAEKDDFAEGLRTLLENDRWRTLGEKGHAYVDEFFSYDAVINRHLEIYRQMLEKK